ncbi:sugar phosphate isomerase/epimerase [Azospirillum sp. OGB3]|uniref:sugar phosphate isomerase/epimerase family protein n=1 Tax=Azospirillum sp. OGB3 TaxID=2587012 RepID=UPI001606B586|nr:sugar phosphate isomerase/epimerase family protein [Azospirillum sp. OGB3]MBB3265165.1 sugar phosphate isomerase/epimerase [Azospirillum sp. OGB3]
MSKTAKRDINLSFFMFTANLQPGNEAYTEVIIRHIKAMTELGYDGFDLPIHPVQTTDHAAEVESYTRMRRAFDRAGLEGVRFTTNVGTTRTFDPTSPYRQQREQALAYLKSRVDITAVLGGASVMAGPFVFPYGVFPTTDDGDPIWSDALQEWLKPRYEVARPVLQELGEYAERKGVKLGIEPVDHWETPAPNMVSDVLDFLRGVQTAQTGLTIDSAHVVLGSNGPLVFEDNLRTAVAQKRLHYVHISAPDRGAVHDSWIPWGTFLRPILPVYHGPLLVEVFNAVPPFTNLLRLTRRKFWIPGEDEPEPGLPSAYDIAREGLATLEREIGRLSHTH